MSKHLIAVLALAAAPGCLAQTFGALTISDSNESACRVVTTLTSNAAVQLEYGVTDGGPYPYTGTIYRTGIQSAPSDSLKVALDFPALAPATTYYGKLIAYPKAARVSSASWTSGTATLTLTDANNFSIGDSVNVSGVSAGGYNSGAGMTVTLTGSSGSTISYALASNPGSGTSGFAISTASAVTSSQVSCTTTSATLPVAPTEPTKWIPAYPTTTGSGWTTITLTASASRLVAASTVTHTGGVFCASDPSWTVTAGDNIQTILNEVNYGAVIELPQGAQDNVPDTATFHAGYLLPALAVDPCSTGMNDPNHRWIMFRTHQVNTSDFPPYDNTYGPARIGPAWASTVATLQAQQPTTVLNSSGQIFSPVQGPASPIHHFWFSTMQWDVTTGGGNGPYGAYIWFCGAEGGDACGSNPPDYIVIERNILQGNPNYPASSSVITQEGIGGTVGSHVAIMGNYIAPFQQAGAIANGIYIADCSLGPLTILNNEIDSAGEEVYYESVGTTSCNGTGPQIMQNAWAAKNALYERPTWLHQLNAGYGMWDSTQRIFRNPFESKNCQICEWEGNYVSGAFSYQNTGAAFLITPILSANTATGKTGAHDLTLRYNFINHASVVMEAWGTSVNDGCCGAAPDAALNSRLYFHDNMGINLGRTYNQDAGNTPGVYSELYQIYGVQSAQIVNNSMSLNNADFCPTSSCGGAYWNPSILMLSDGNYGSNGLVYQGNIDYFGLGGSSGTAAGGITAPSPTCSNGCSLLPISPLPTLTTYATVWQTAAIQTASSVTATGTWTGNLHIGANKYTGAEPWPAMSAADVSAQQSNMPDSACSACYPTGATVAARETAAGFTNSPSTTGDFTCSAASDCTGLGASLTNLENGLGLARNISVSAASSSITVSATAPDNHPCSVFLAPTAGGTKTVTAYSGSPGTSQSITVSGLAASTSYTGDLMCYYLQDATSAPWLSVPTEHTTINTHFSISTTSASSPGSVYGAGVSGAGVR